MYIYRDKILFSRVSARDSSANLPNSPMHYALH